MASFLSPTPTPTVVKSPTGALRGLLKHAKKASHSSTANPLTGVHVATQPGGGDLMLTTTSSLAASGNDPAVSASSPNTIVAATSATVATATNNNNTTNNNNSSNTNQLQVEDIEIMKQRSANNNTFLCIKITDVQLLVSYRGGEKENNLKDLNNVRVLFPLFEVHDKTWTWLDLVNALKPHVKKALVSQALKHKFIKVPIKPVMNLRARNSNHHSHNHHNHSHQQQHDHLSPRGDHKQLQQRQQQQQQQSTSASYTNSEIDEQEKVTLLKLFGTKFIEKKSSKPTSEPVVLVDTGAPLTTIATTSTSQPDTTDAATANTVERKKSQRHSKLFRMSSLFK